MTTRILSNDFRALWDDIGDEVMVAVERMGRSGWYILGTEVAGFEQDLATFHGVAHAVGCASGLDAIEIGLRAAGIGSGDEVLTSPLTAFATALAILRTGATPVFADVDELGLLSLDSVAAVLSSRPSIRAVIPVHLFGHAVEIEPLRILAAEHGCVVLEDAAQAIGASSGGAPVGATTVGAATSFYPTKNLGALGDGGALLTNDADIATAARQLRDYGQRAKYEHVVAGLNSRLDELQAAILRTAVLPGLRVALDRRAAIAERYLNGIRNHRIVVRPPATPSTWHLFPVFVASVADRDALQAHLTQHEIQTAVHYPILASAQLALADLDIGARDFPVAQRLADTEVSLPIHPYLSDDDVDRVIESCNSW